MASAIALLTRNFYAQRALDIISPVEDTYLYAEINGWNGDKYKATLAGCGDVEYTKNGEKMTSEEIDADERLTRPYREDNLTVYVAGNRKEFFDFLEYVPSYLSRLTPYSRFSAELIQRAVEIPGEEKWHGVWNRKRFAVEQKRKNRMEIEANPVLERSEIFHYSCFLHTSKFSTFVQVQDKKRYAVYEPLLVQGLKEAIPEDRWKNALFSTDKTMHQAFYFE